MPSLNPYPKSKSQPCFVMRFTDPLTHRQQTKYLHLSEKEAKKVFELKQSELTRIKYGLTSSTTNYTLNKLKNLYLNHVKANLNSRTYSRYKSAIEDFISIVGNVRKVKRFHYEQYRRQSPRKIGGIVSQLRQVKVMLNWCYAMEYISSVPVVPKFPRPRHTPTRILSDAEIKKILSCEDITDNDRKLVLLYLHTGARARELLAENFSWKNVDKRNKMIHLGKGNKYHKVELSNTAYKILMSWKHRDSPIPYTYTYIRKHIAKVSKLSKVKFTAHNLRGAAGAILLRNGATIYEVSKFLGHSSVTVTEKYYIDLLKDDYVNLTKKLEKGISKLV